MAAVDKDDDAHEEEVDDVADALHQKEYVDDAHALEDDEDDDAHAHHEN